MTLEKALSRFESNELSNLEVARSRRATVVEHENQKQETQAPQYNQSWQDVAAKNPWPGAQTYSADEKVKPF